MTIIQLDPIRVKFSMSTRDFLNNFSDIEGLKKNCTVKIKMADNSFFDEEGAIEFVNNEAVKTTDTIQVFAKFKNSKSRLLPNNTVAVCLGIILTPCLYALVQTIRESFNGKIGIKTR